jgi:uncharacterized membrane protein
MSNAAVATEQPAARIDSLDLVRGIVMVLMAIDHVRVYAGVPAGSPDPAVFFTRWITHFVAPAFCFFAGTAAYLHGRKLNDAKALTRFLVSRGLILVALELTLLRFFWTFNFDYAHYMLAGVIWMLGWCMVLMGGLVRFSTKTIGIVGLAVIFLQQLTGLLGKVMPGPLGVIYQFLYGGGWVSIGQGGIGVLYVVVPWIGVMAAGYAFGDIMLRDTGERRRLCLRIGLSATAAFLVIGSILAVMSGAGGGEEGGQSGAGVPFIFRLFNQQKYPASQLFLLMTLGPTIALLPLAERARGRRMWQWLTTFGRVPMFYYLLHIPTIHIAAMIVSKIREGHVNPWLFGNHPYAPPDLPPGYRWSLGLLYLVWASCLVALYFPSAWYAKLRATKRYPWLSYI